ncbi:MAG: response regulator transcription factor [Chloroflexota bacterium]
MRHSRRILVADSSKYFNATFWRMLIPEPEFEIVGLANNTEDALKMAHTLSPDIVLADITRSTLSGLRIVEALRAVHPGMPIITFRPVASQEYTQAALNAGATACLTKSELAEVLPQTLYNLTQGQSPVSTNP